MQAGDDFQQARQPILEGRLKRLYSIIVIIIIFIISIIIIIKAPWGDLGGPKGT